MRILSSRAHDAMALAFMDLACGRVEDVESPLSAPAGERQPGWYDVPAEPATIFVGELSIASENGTISGTVYNPALPTDRLFYLAMKWPGEAPIAITELLKPADRASYRAALNPPGRVRKPSLVGSCSGERAEGILLAYLARPNTTTPDPASDELIGASFKQKELFSYNQTAYNTKVTWDTCVSIKRWIPSLFLQRDARLAFALCEEPVNAGRICGQPVLDRTRVESVDLAIDSGFLNFGLSDVGGTMGESTTVEVNGVAFDPKPRTEPGIAPFHAGENFVRVKTGQLAPWEAKVVLPTSSLRPRLVEAALRQNAPFTVAWDDAPWATSFDVRISPVDGPIRRVAYPEYAAKGSSVTATFEGFDDAKGGKDITPRARVRLNARVTGQGTLSWAEEFNVNVLP